jgi:hypothetical protein
VLDLKYKAPGQCPVCHHEMDVNKLKCPNCKITIEGEFSTCRFCQLPPEQMEFLDAFIRCKGNIKDIEIQLGISYPTVKNRLNGLIHALGYSVEDESEEMPVDSEKKQRQEILDALERGEIKPTEAAKLLRKVGK